MGTASLTQRTSSIKVYAETAFAVVFISTYWDVCQKRSLYNFFLIKKMGVYQNAVKEFLDLTSDDAMLDWWIPDKDWVQQMQLNCKSDCSVANLNIGLAKQCVFENNNAILQGTKILFNKKRVKILKTKATKKYISFYYVLSPSKLVPTIPSDQGFYQLLWDNITQSIMIQ